MVIFYFPHFSTFIIWNYYIRKIYPFSAIIYIFNHLFISTWTCIYLIHVLYPKTALIYFIYIDAVLSFWHRPILSFNQSTNLLFVATRCYGSSYFFPPAIDCINVSWLIFDFLLFLLKVKQNYIGEAKDKSLVAKISFQSDCKSQLSVTCLSTITRHLLYLILLNLFHKKQKT